MAVKILVRLAGAHAAPALRCHKKWPVSRLTRATSWASTAGTGMGRRVVAGRDGVGVEVAAAEGVGVGEAGGSAWFGRSPVRAVPLAAASSVAARASWVA